MPNLVINQFFYRETYLHLHSWFCKICDAIKQVTNWQAILYKILHILLMAVYC